MEVKQSNIPGAGMGLFTNGPIKKGDFIMKYEGTKVARGSDPTDGRYSYYVGNSVIIGANYARFINDNVAFRKFTRAETVDFFHGRKLPRLESPHNIAFVENAEDETVDIVATADINAGDELLGDYGFGYWVPRVLRAGLTDHTYNIGHIRL